jgi:hypothetical protein
MGTQNVQGCVALRGEGLASGDSAQCESQRWRIAAVANRSGGESKKSESRKRESTNIESGAKRITRDINPEFPELKSSP